MAAQRDTIIIEFNDGKKRTKKMSELRTLFNYFKNITMLEYPEHITFNQFTREEFDLVMRFVHKKCRNHNYPTPTKIDRLLSFLSPRFKMDESFANCAAESGDTDLLIWALKNHCPVNKWTPAFAARKGNIDCLKILFRHGCSFDSWSCDYAARKGHLDCLIWLHRVGCPWNKWTCVNATAGDHLPCLIYAYENGCPFDKVECIDAIKRIGSECLGWLHEH